jgi:glycosyltransferase involved in cell wall biosynthesis
MRIALVVHDLDRAFGHGRYVAELASRFPPHHDVHVFANTFGESPAGVTCHHVPALRASALTTILSFYPAASAAVRRPSLAAPHRRAFDIVHAQGFSVGGANVVTAHISNEGWMAARRELCEGHLPWRERVFGAVVTPLERRALRAPGATVIAVSAALERELARNGSRSPCVVIPHGVDTVQFNPDVVPRYRGELRRAFGCASDDEPLFLFVGDLRKGFAHAIAALENVSGRLVAVTRSDPAEMLALADSRGVAARVRIYPSMPRIEQAYAAADAFVFPTRYDAFGMVITEAMACGLPVITTAAAGAAELIDHGRTGLVLQNPADTGALTAFMRTLATDPAFRRAMGREAAGAMRAHSWDIVATDTLAVYEQIVTRTAAAA